MGEGHQHDHDHDDDHAHSAHEEPRGWWGRITSLAHGHSHDAPVDDALETSERGIRTLKLSFAALIATALFQVAIVALSGSVALLADTIHNFSDALSSIPLWFAFVLGRRAANRKYTYGYGRVEDLAGVAIVLLMLASAALVAFESYRKLLNPEPFDHIGWVMLAAIVGFAGNELVALYRVRVGKEIGSAALVADGHHARVDGLTSLAVLAGAIGVAAGYPAADPIVGLIISVMILLVVRDAAVRIWHRLTDAVDPGVVDSIEAAAASVVGPEAPHDIRVRWLGHRLVAELHITVDEDLPTRRSHEIAEEVEAALRRTQPRLSQVIVHVDPCGHGAPASGPETVHQH